jgi:hypothetical protein
MVLFGSAFLYFLKKDESELQVPFPTNVRTQIFYLLLFSLVIFLPFAWFKIPYTGYLYPGYMGDYLYYSEIAEFAFKTGNENIHGVSNLFGPEYQGMSPYHFLDLWLNSLISETMGWSYVSVLETIVWAVLRFILIVGLLGIVEKYFKINFTIILLVTLFLFFGAFYFSFFNASEFLQWNIKLLQSVASGKKIAATCLFIIGFYLLWISKNQTSAICLLVAGSFASIGNSTGIAGGIFLFGVLQYIWGEKQMTYFAWGISLFSLIGTGLLYRFFGVQFPAINYSVVFSHIFEFPLLKLKFLLSYLATGLAYNFLLAFVFIVGAYRIGFLNRLNSLRRSAILLLLLVFFCAAGTAALFTGEFPDGDQFYMNLYIPIISLFVFLAFLHLKQLLGLTQRLYTISLVAFGLFAGYQAFDNYYTEKTNSIYWASNYSNEYLATIQTQLKNIKNPIGASININSPYAFSHKKYYYYNPLGYYMKTLSKGFHTIGLSYYEICTQSKLFETLCSRERFGFYQYATREFAKNEHLTSDQLKLKFIDDYAIDYLIVEANATIPSDLEKRLILVAKDNISGESFYLIERKI